MLCPSCNFATPDERNFCIHCKHRVRDLRKIRVDSRWMPSRRAKMDRFAETGDPAVFAKPGAPDYDPALSAV